MVSWRRASSLLILLLLSTAPTFAQWSAPLDEVSLGLRQRGEIVSRYRLIVGTAEHDLARDIFSRLMQTSLPRQRPELPFEVLLVDLSVVNASSTAGGKVYVYSGILPLLEKEPGLWAAVLSHELAHTVRGHQYEGYLRWFARQQQIAYLRARAAAGDQNANWGLLGATIGSVFLDPKLDREQEHDADRVGMMLMVEAGYHPDYMVKLQQRIGRFAGDKGKFAAFFSTHPRWATREQRTMRVYQEALGWYRSLWPDSSQAPGGPPPLVGSLGKVAVEKDSKARVLRVEVPVTIRNAGGRGVLVGLGFSTPSGTPAVSALPEFRGPEGRLRAVHLLEPVGTELATKISLVVPAAAWAERNRKLKMEVVLASENEVLDWSPAKHVEFPKP